jgi:hypothetical protein
MCTWKDTIIMGLKYVSGGGLFGFHKRRRFLALHEGPQLLKATVPQSRHNYTH